MINIQLNNLLVLVAFWLCFIRWMGIFVQLPIFDNVSIPMSVKVLTTLIITYAFFPKTSVSVMKEIKLVGDNHFWVLSLYHTIVGLMIGFLAKVIIDIFTMSGSLISQ